MQALATAPDLILHNGQIYTVDASMPWAEAIAIRKHRIIALGSTRAVLTTAGPATRCIDLGGRLVLPGLCDAHIHLLAYALGLHELRLSSAQSRHEMLRLVGERAATLPSGAWLVGQGWNESRWGETDFPTAAELDAVTGDHPALLYRSDLHSAVANSAAMQVAGITSATPDPENGIIDRDARGNPTGFLREHAAGLVDRFVPPPTDAQQLAALTHAQTVLHGLGVTAVHAQRIKDGTDGRDEWSALLRLRENHELRLRVNCNIAAHDLPHLLQLGLRTGFGDNHLRLGHIKVFSDGSLGSRTAWMLEPFAKLAPGENNNEGVNVTPPAQMAQEFRAATAAGFPISVHAIGDRANRVVLDIFEELADGGLTPPIPHRIEHVQIIAPEDLPRLGQLGITASVQPIHATDDMDTADRFLGARGAHMYNFRSLLESGALLAFGSDAPVADPNPFLGVHAALTRQRPERMPAPPWYPNECLSLDATIYAYTLGAAKAAGWEQLIGSLAPGKLADLIVLDRNLFELERIGIQGDEVANTQVLLTVFGGEVVHDRL